VTELSKPTAIVSFTRCCRIFQEPALRLLRVYKSSSALANIHINACVWCHLRRRIEIVPTVYVISLNTASIWPGN
jgi:hypothetical protein